MNPRRSGQAGEIIFRHFNQTINTTQIPANTSVSVNVTGADVEALSLTTEDDIYVTPLNGLPGGIIIAGCYVESPTTIVLKLANCRTLANGPYDLPMRFRVL